ncbi:MAG: phosphoribosylformylglycinamidine synthase [Treponema sp.]|jgi:phosphoribosylformylglycinamidine synthase|nr:phosphoribosylformylglycinamidine synthase [Treponema sp.]
MEAQALTKVRRVFVEKRVGFDTEVRRLRSDFADFLGVQYPELARLRGLRVLNRYDVSGLDKSQFEQAVSRVFSELQCDEVFHGDSVPAEKGDIFFAVEYLPGQYNQRSDSAEQCVELVTGLKPAIRSAWVYILQPGDISVSDAAVAAVKRYLINPVDSREASMDPLESLGEIETKNGIPIDPGETPILWNFIAANDGCLAEISREYGLAMSTEDLRFCREWFSSVGRDPTLAELRVLDAYWSDHCRHTTFNTILEKIEIDGSSAVTALKQALELYESARNEVYGPAGAARPRSLMDMAVIGVKLLRKRGLAGDVDESKEINACTIKIKAEFSDGSSEPWLLLFKNETHNHPTEIEPFGGAATCLGGAIRDPLSGRAYVHQAMRISGGGDPGTPLGETIKGKLPQIKIAREAAAGYASYGNQIGIATGQVSEFYHPGFLAKRMELGAVIAAVPAAWVRREEPVSGDMVILVGGKTGRDGIGGAAGSSKVHTGESLDTAGAEVQKGNAVEERKLQRLFRNPETARLIKRCNDFGAGGVSVAVGELAAGLDIDLDQVPKKYAGLTGIELAISESQERMAVVVAPDDAGAFIKAAAAENLDAVVIATVTADDTAPEEKAALRMKWRGRTIVDLSRKFLNSNGAPRSVRVRLSASSRPAPYAGNKGAKDQDPGVLLDELQKELMSLRSGSRRGLQERFDGSIGAASILFPWGGAEQGTPECGMAALLPSLEKQSHTASLMSFGYDPDLMEWNPYEGAKGAVREALAKFACLGGDPWKARLSLQEYFERPESPDSWGKPAAALLGALEAQLTLGIPAIGGKDSMSGNYRDKACGIDISVPPTLVAFAAGTAPAASVRSGALSGETGNVIILLAQAEKEAPAAAGRIRTEWEIFKANMDALAALSAAGCVHSAYPVGPGGAAVSLALMAFGNNTGIEAKPNVFSLAAGPAYQGSVLFEIDRAMYRDNPIIGEILNRAGCWAAVAVTIADPEFRITCEENGKIQTAKISLPPLRRMYEYPLSRVYPQTSAAEPLPGKDLSAPAGKTARIHAGTGKKRFSEAAPLAVLPVFPGTNCEWDMERAFREAGARTRQVIFRNRSGEDITESIRELAAAIGEAQILALAGGFSAGDEPDGSGKFIANVLRSPAAADAVGELLEKRDGLILGICNGFQALIKLGLVPYGDYRAADNTMPTLTFNRVGRHVSRMVRTRVMSNNSPWLTLEEPGAVHLVPVSHGEGRLVIRHEEGQALFKNGQVPFCYAGVNGLPAAREPDNPNGSDFAIEGLTSPDGRILGKMGHSERQGEYVHINIPGNKRQRIFEAGVRYFKG